MTAPYVALLAGEGKMPLVAIQGIHASGKRVFLLALHNITSQELASLADDVIWLHLTQLGKAIRECRKRAIHELIMAGRVPHTSIFSLSLLRMDWTTIKTWFSLPDKRGDTILGGIANAFTKSGITVMDSTTYLQDHMAKLGVLTRARPSSKTMDDVFFGLKLAKEMGRLNIGQTVVIKNKTIVAVEAMEGTDKCLERSGEIAGKGCVVIKMPKSNQDMRFDVPTIGVNTIHKLAKIGATALAIEAGKTLIIDDETIEVANGLGIAIISMSAEETENGQ